MPQQDERHFGKYRGVVTNNIDPMMLGRLQVKVPAVLGENSLNWAMPAVPYAGNQVGIFFIPPVGANIWVEFEAGNKDYPIWSGCFWGTGELPTPTGVPQTKMIKTDTVTITLDDLIPNTIKLETTQGMKIVIEASGITIDNGMGAKIELTGPQVSVNSGALEVI
ncbi:MAG: phage baseplate assembly protein V [Caldilineaceae bacterium]